jgi:hypothetical protein
MEAFHKSQEFLDLARQKAKKTGYNPKKLRLATNNKNKLTYESPLGLRHFGARGYGDFIYYSKFEPEIAEQKRRVFRASHGAITKEYMLDKFSPNELAMNILW